MCVLTEKSCPPPGDFVKCDIPDSQPSPTSLSDKDGSRPDRSASMASSQVPLIDNDDSSDEKQSVSYQRVNTHYTLWLACARGSAVERQSLASVLLPSCARPVADG